MILAKHLYVERARYFARQKWNLSFIYSPFFLLSCIFSSYCLSRHQASQTNYSWLSVVLRLLLGLQYSFLRISTRNVIHSLVHFPCFLFQVIPSEISFCERHKWVREWVCERESQRQPASLFHLQSYSYSALALTVVTVNLLLYRVLREFSFVTTELAWKHHFLLPLSFPFPHFIPFILPLTDLLGWRWHGTGWAPLGCSLVLLSKLLNCP